MGCDPKPTVRKHRPITLIRDVAFWQAYPTESPRLCCGACSVIFAPRIDAVQKAYSITSSAMESTLGGTSMPSALAVLRLRTNSNLVDCTTGRSVGLVPLRMLPV